MKPLSAVWQCGHHRAGLEHIEHVCLDANGTGRKESHSVVILNADSTT